MIEVMSASCPPPTGAGPNANDTRPDPADSGGSVTQNATVTMNGVPQALGALLDEVSTSYPTVTWLDEDTDAVVLNHGATGAKVLLPNGVVRFESLDRPAAAITDPARQAELLRRAMDAVIAQTRAERLARDTERVNNTRMLRRIRSYAVARHRDGDICREGLDAFLNEFDLDPYQPTVRVRFTITGSYLVATNSGNDAERDGRGYLGIDLSRVDDVVDGSEDFDLHIDGVDHINDDD